MTMKKNYPDETVAINAKGKKEARVLKFKGQDYVVYGYVAIDTGKAENKYSILLRKENKEIEHFFIIKLPTGKELIVKHESESAHGKRGIFDEKSRKIIYF